jgi:site-specific recombinase XerD
MEIERNIQSYLNYLDLKEITKESYKNILSIFKHFLMTRGVIEPTRNDLLVFKEEMLKKVGSATVQKYIVVLRGFFRYLKVQGLYEDISYQVRGCKVETTYKRMPLSIEDSIKLIAKAKKKAKAEIGKRDYALVVLFLTTGLRSIEASRANIEDIDLVNGDYVLHIQGKGRDTKAEFVKLSEETYQALQDYLSTTNQDDIENEGNVTPLFLTKSKKGKQHRLSTKGIRSLVKDLLIAIGYSSRAYSVHSLRHTFATTALLQGASILQTQEALRHKNISTTQIYSHMLEGFNSNTNKLVSDALFKIRKEKHSK